MGFLKPGIAHCWLFFLCGFSILGCAAEGPSATATSQLHSPSYDGRVKFLVLHFTAVDFASASKALMEDGKASAHYLLPQRFDPTYSQDQLKVFQLVDEQYRAWHAEQGIWQGASDINGQSIGIELVNVPQCKEPMGHHFQRGEVHGDASLCIFPDFDPEQIELLVSLMQDILKRYPHIGPTQIVGHSDVSPSRTHDPGPRFPWQRLYQAGIGAWYDNDRVNHYWQSFSARLPSLQLIQQGLAFYGYDLAPLGRADAQTRNVLTAFQSHFLPWHINGEATDKTAATLFALLEKYFPEKAKLLWQAYEQETAATVWPDPQMPTQFDGRFPERRPSDSSRVNNKRQFRGYAQQGELLLTSEGANEAEILVNGKILDIPSPLSPGKPLRVSLKGLSRDGINTLEVRNIRPKGKALRIEVPYPELIQATTSPYDFSKVDKLISEEVAQGFPGAVLLVVKDGKIQKHQAYGYQRVFADNGKRMTQPQPMQKDSLFDLASLTKMYATNFALMKLASEGRLDWHKPLSFYLPDYRGDGRALVRIKDLLDHTAGYAPEVHFFDPNNPLGEAFFSQDRQLTERLLLTKVPLQLAHQAKPRYSDVDYMLLGILVERLTGMSLDQYVEQEIYAPLGLKQLMFNPLQKGVPQSRFAATEIQGNTRGGRVTFPNIRTYVLQGEVHDEKAYYSLGGVAGHAGLFGSAEELAVLAQVLLNRGGYGQVGLFDASVLDRFTLASELDIATGLGWQRAANGERRWAFGPYASPLAIGHTGWTGVITVIDPTYDMAIILLTNKRHTPVVGKSAAVRFATDEFELSRYGSVVTAVYEAILGI
ncbi:penicillin binding protein PBP4B [Aliiglaciecola sp. CAU 1673]|uniref:penicillin binding protein PBP4B n=1 Tax=Aliiglaciecola sp. CAU 1673 TaxID=3032595 RepID=UPI0023DC131C|nr:penicillin binding protein PBP4B [Aliiglaciecola sp. CAU 1673]MDF2177333.1 penicillin binding protein PBP4B [Aliiglaciecola sp. CAU 1673]